MDSSENTSARMLLRFCAELTNASVLKPDSLLGIFGGLVDAAVEVSLETSCLGSPTFL